MIPELLDRSSPGANTWRSLVGDIDAARITATGLLSRIGFWHEFKQRHGKAAMAQALRNAVDADKQLRELQRLHELNRTHEAADRLLAELLA